MVNNESYLKLLIGKYVTKTEYSSSTIAPINGDKNDPFLIKASVFVQIYFEDYRLNIYNTMHVIPSDRMVNDFIGLKVMEVYETKEEAILKFKNNYKIIVDMRDEAYSDPEAMYLAGPNNFWTVWN